MSIRSIVESRKCLWLYFALVLITVALRVQPSLWRPLEQDELVSIKKNTGVPYDATIDQLKAGKRMQFGVGARGMVKCFLNPWDPNNHIIHNLAVSVSEALFGFSEASFRLPALIASVALPLLLF